MSLRPLSILLTSSVALAAVAACQAENVNVPITIKDPKLDVKMSQGQSDTVEAGQSVKIDVNVENGYLVEKGATPPAEHKSDAVYVDVHLDQVTETPLVTTASTQVNVQIPAGTPPGDHKLLVRVLMHSTGAVKSTQEVKVKVKASSSTGGTTNP